MVYDNFTYLHLLTRKCYISSGTDVIQVYASPSTPPDTRIISAIDGNGNILANDSSAVSTSIQFTFVGIGTSIVRFECSLGSSRKTA
jgi:hypothetical protein